ncbi:MAG: DUF447 family protein [Acidobacteria bacterium]|nr:DUF447 family protein [Acidobacteriota bacterium]
MPMIRECIVTTRSEEGKAHIAPLGLIADDDGWIISPFKPSTTLENLRTTPYAVASFTDDVLVFAGCLVGNRDWPLRPAEKVPGAVLAGALAHAELEVREVEEDELRPRFHCRIVYAANHAPFKGFNRAQGAVIEAAILASRLHMLPREKIEQELAYLQIAVEKTAGPREHEAWRILIEKIEDHYKHAPRKD